LTDEIQSVAVKGYAWIKDFPSQLLINFVKTYNLLERILQQHYGQFGLSEAKFNALFLLYRAKGGLLLSELGEQMLVTRANITGLVDRLEKEGLVERFSHPTDRRSIIAKITRRGRKLIEAVIPTHMELNRKLLSCFNEEEKKLVVTLLEKFYQRLVQLEEKMQS